MNHFLIRKTVIFIIIILYFSLVGVSQTIDSVPIPHGTENFGISANGEMYYQTKNGISRYNSENIYINDYQNKNYGSVFQSDLSNYLKQFVYYKDFNVLIILDSHLKEITAPINFEAFNSSSFSLFTAFDAESFFFYDENSTTIKRISGSLRVESESLEVNKLAQNDQIPVALRHISNNLYLQFKDKILVFDTNLNFIKTIPTPQQSDFFLLNSNEILYNSNSEVLIVEDLKTGFKKKINYSISSQILKVLQTEKCIYLLTNKFLYRIAFQ